MISALICLLLVATPARPESADLTPFHGFLPNRKLRALDPPGDNHPNDIYKQSQPGPAQIPNGYEIHYPDYKFTFDIPKDPEKPVYIITPKTPPARKGHFRNDGHHQMKKDAFRHAPTPKSVRSTVAPHRRGGGSRKQSSAAGFAVSRPPRRFTPAAQSPPPPQKNNAFTSSGGFNRMQPITSGPMFSTAPGGPLHPHPNHARAAAIRPTSPSGGSVRPTPPGFIHPARPTTQRTHPTRPASANMKHVYSARPPPPRSFHQSFPPPKTSSPRPHQPPSRQQPERPSHANQRRPTGPPTAKAPRSKPAVPAVAGRVSSAPSMFGKLNDKLRNFPAEQYRVFPGGYARLSTYSSLSG